MSTKSQNKMGAFGSVPVVPLMPCEAQLAKAYHGTLHLRFQQGSGMYVSGRVPAIPPSRVLALKAALDQCETETSWSGAGTTYWKLTVKPEPDKSRAGLYAGSELIGYVMIDPTVEIVSTDETIQQQIDHQKGGSDDD